VSMGSSSLLVLNVATVSVNMEGINLNAKYAVQDIALTDD
jgi:hypothetical protein